MGESRTVEIPQKWPLVNTLSSRQNNFLKDARLVNAYAEQDVLTGDVWVGKRPGFSSTAIVGPATSGAAAQPYGCGMVSCTFGNTIGLAPYIGTISLTVYIQYTGTAYGVYCIATDSSGNQTNSGLIGTVEAPTYGFSGLQAPTKMRFLVVPNVNVGQPPNIYFFWGIGSSVAYGGYAGSTLYELSATFPGAPSYTLTYAISNGLTQFPEYTVPGIVFLNGYTYVMDTAGTIWQTAAQYTVIGTASWSATAYITAGTDGDVGVFFARQGIYVVAMKSWTIQIFYDAGNPAPGSSLSPVPGALYEVGCLSPDTVVNLDGALFWVTQSKTGSARVALMQSLELSYISTPAVERQLELNTAQKFYSMAYQHEGHRWYVLTNVTANVTMVYDVDLQIWLLWTDYQGNCYPFVDRCTTFGGAEWQQHQNGAIYQMGSDYQNPNDYGNIVPVDIYTPNFDAGVDRRKYLSQMRFHADQTPGSTLYVRSSNDDYGSWTNFRKVDLSKNRPILNDCGSFYRRAYHFRHFANTALRIRAVALQMDIGTL